MSNNKKNNSGIWLKLIFVFLIACFVITVSFFLLISERPTHSDSEKRDLASKPKLTFSSLMDGSYFKGLQTYYNDTVPMRETFKVWGSKILTYKGTVSDEGLIFVPVIVDKTPEPVYTDAPTEEPTAVPTATPEPTWTPTLDPDATPVPETPTPTPTPTEAPTPTPTPKEDENDFWMNEHGVVFYKGRGMDLYGGTKEWMQKFTGSVNKLVKAKPNIRVYSMACPLACAYYLPRSVYSGTGDQKKDISTMNAMLDSSVKTVDAYSALEKHTDEYIYFKTDHHWSYLGAYYACEEFCKVAGVPFDKLSTFTAKKQSGTWLGSLYSTYNLNQLSKYPDEVTYYVTSRAYTVEYYNKDLIKFDFLNSLYSESSKGYNVVIGGNDGVVTHVKTNAGTGRTLVILKDSFGNATIPYMLAGFDEIWMVDCRYFNKNFYDCLDTWGATDVLIIGDVFMQCSSLAKYVQNILG